MEGTVLLAFNLGIDPSRQKEYYDAPDASDKQTDSAKFVELMLEIIRDSLTEVTEYLTKIDGKH